MIRLARKSDSHDISQIYNHYVCNTVVTFEEEPVEAAEMALRIESTLQSELPWLVAEHDGKIVGYAYASKWKGRCAYKYSVETTVYLDSAAVSKGVGSALYGELLSILREKEFHVALGGIALPNPKSIALHEKYGFVKAAHFEEVGYKFNKWVDVGYWQIKLKG